MKIFTTHRQKIAKKKSTASINFGSDDESDCSFLIGSSRSTPATPSSSTRFTASTPTTPSTLIPTRDSKRAKRPRYSTLSRQPHLPTLITGSRGVQYAVDPQTGQIIPQTRSKTGRTESLASSWQPSDSDVFGVTRFSPVKNAAESHMQYRNKQRRQWENWMKILPSLVQDYLEFLYLTEHMQFPAPSISPASPCACPHTRQLDIACIFFDRIEDITIAVCGCKSAPAQLVRRGLFCCSPIHPSLAVDIGMLDFVTELYVRMPPNQTAWCEALEHVLRKREYSLRTRDTLRKRFSNALQWFRLVDAHATDFIAKTAAGFDDPLSSSRLTEDLTICRPLSTPRFDDIVVGPPSSPSRRWERTPPPHGVTTTSSPSSSPYSSPSSSPTPVHARLPYSRSHTHSDDFAPTSPSSSSGGSLPAAPSPSQPPDVPSSYLRRRCPLCFGGKDVDDVVVCLDACFTQKRTRNSDDSADRDPPRIHPDTAFLSEEYVDDVQAYVERQRKTPPSRRSAPAASSLVDGFEKGMKLPTSILNSCSDSFLAADEKREKASTTFFVDTGLMGILCRHDHPLWLANMKHAGERQHYAIALIKRLFEDLPEHTSVKLLYDIRCQTHRSFEKHDLLPQYRSRITFAVSVFHAYGHQWACQLLYHPRKCIGFGLSDGEGSERLWHALSLLIAINRVSGHYQRQLNIDLRVCYLNDKATFNHAKWEVRRWNHAQDLKQQASKELEECGVAVKVLQKEWKAQVAEQTRPLERQSKNKGSTMIDKVMGLYKILDVQKQDTIYLARQIAEALCPAYLRDEYGQRLQQSVELERTTGNEIAKITQALGTTDRDRLQTLRNNAFLTLLLNANAVKQRMCSHVVQRKIELSQLDRACRRTVNEVKLADHAEQAAKRREAGVNDLLKTFNKLAGDLQGMAAEGKAPKGYTAPKKIQREGLFGLDVDDDIWMDIGLPKEEDIEKPVPRWLGDENVRKGIRAMQLVDRCNEEMDCVKKECLSLREWMAGEWRAVELALDRWEDIPYINYHLSKAQASLITLCAVWEMKLRSLPFWPTKGVIWGLPKDVIDAAISEEEGKGKDCRGNSVVDDEYLADFDDTNPSLDMEVVDILEATGYMEYTHAGYDIHPSATVVPGQYLQFPPRGYTDFSYRPETPNSSPSKRKRLY